MSELVTEVQQYVNKLETKAKLPIDRIQYHYSWFNKQRSVTCKYGSNFILIPMAQLLTEKVGKRLRTKFQLHS